MHPTAIDRFLAAVPETMPERERTEVTVGLGYLRALRKESGGFDREPAVVPDLRNRGFCGYLLGVPVYSTPDLPRNVLVVTLADEE
jgi:hypothetical protein